LALAAPCLTPRGDYLVMNLLPFAEDLRSFPFAPLPAAPVGADAAAEALVDAMMFGPAAAEAAAAAGDSPALAAFVASADPRLLRNPTLRRFYDLLLLRTLSGAEAPPPLPEWDGTHLPRALGGEAAAAAARAFAAAAPVKRKERRRRAEEPPGGPSYPSSKRSALGSSEAEAEAEAAAAEAAAAAGSVALRPAITVSAPAAEFAAALAYARAEGSPDAVSGAVAELVYILFQLVDFYGTPNLSALLDGAAALRAACLAEEMPASYNSFLTNIFLRSCGKAGGGAWAALAARAEALGYITTEELPGVGRSGGAEEPEAARALMARDAAAEPSLVAAEPEAEAFDEDELGGDLDGMD